MMVLQSLRAIRVASSLGFLKRLAPLAAAALLAACASTPAPDPLPQPPAPEPVAPPPPPIQPQPEPEPEPEPEPITGLVPPHMEGRDIARVALLLPFSAENAGARAESLRLLRAAELALFERGGSGLILIPKDTQGTPDGARGAARTAVDEGADIVIGPLFATSVAAAGEVTRPAGVPMIAFSTDSDVAGDGVYLLSFPPEIEVERIVDYAALQGVERFAYLGPQNRYGQAVSAALTDRAYKNFAEVTAESFYTGDVEAMTRAAARLAEGVFEELTPEDAEKLSQIDWRPSAEAPFQAVILPEGGVRLRTLAPLLISQPVDPLVIRFLGTGLWMDEDLLREPALYGGWFAGPNLETRERFEDSYEEAFGSEPSRIASLSYDAMALAADLDGGELGFSREAIEYEQGFYGADGLFRFHADGLIERGLAIYQIHPRGFREIAPAPDTFEPLAF